MEHPLDLFSEYLSAFQPEPETETKTMHRLSLWTRSTFAFGVYAGRLVDVFLHS